MKVIVAGSRTITKQTEVENYISAAFNRWMCDDPENWKSYCSPEIVSGGAYGVDFCGEVYAKKAGLKCTIFKANWDLYGKSAGFIRNKEMADYADALVAVWDGSSKGTKNMIETMKKQNKPVYVQLV